MDVIHLTPKKAIFVSNRNILWDYATTDPKGKIQVQFPFTFIKTGLSKMNIYQRTKLLKTAEKIKTFRRNLCCPAFDFYRRVISFDLFSRRLLFYHVFSFVVRYL